jgi:hypothetical protein
MRHFLHGKNFYDLEQAGKWIKNAPQASPAIFTRLANQYADAYLCWHALSGRAMRNCDVQCMHMLQ